MNVISQYNVFISYNRADAAEVELLASDLVKNNGFVVWMDKSRLEPGRAWRSEIETAMNASESVLIAWGKRGLGPIQHQERDLAYSIRDSRPSLRVFYCLLPNSEQPQGSWANVDTWIRFSSALDEADARAELAAAIKGEAPPSPLKLELSNEPAPYRGLAAFTVDDMKFFYGRSSYVDEMVDRLKRHPFLSLLGPSGCGKTSLLQAGLIPRLKDATKGQSWRWFLLRPGPNPLRSLASAVVQLHSNPDPLKATEELLERLKTRPEDLPDVIQTLLPQQRWLLIVDRLEEIFTLCEHEEDRQAFLTALISLIRHPHEPACVVAAMRADFYNQVGRYGDLANEMVNHQVYLRPMEEQEVAEIIEAPAAEVGAVFEKGLAKQLGIDAYVRGEMSLPLLQHALDLLWRKRRGRWLTWDAYSEMGAVAGALRYHADRVIEGLSPLERETARRIFVRLIWLDEIAGTLAGRRTLKSDFVNPGSSLSDDERILQRLADERLIVLRGQGDRATVELIHDTLPLNWQRLRDWVQEKRDFLVWQQRLQTDLNEWERTGHDEGGLLRGVALNEAERWLTHIRSDLNSSQQEFIKESLSFREREHAARARLRRRIMIGLTAGLLIALTLATIALTQMNRAKKANNVTLARRLSDQAILFSETQLDLALLLGLEARKADSKEAGLIYLPKLQKNPHLWTYLHGHTATVTSVAFRPPSGETLASASDDGTIIFWDVASRQPVARLPVGAAQVWCLSFSPDGNTLASGDSGGKLLLWDVPSRTQITVVPTSQGAGVLKVTFSPDGRILAASLNDGNIVLWEVAAHRLLGSLNAGENIPYGLEFSPDGKTLAAGLSNHTIVLWDVQSRQPIGQPLAGHDESVMSVAFTPDGTGLISVGSDKKIIVWKVTPGKPAEQRFVKAEACEGRILSVAVTENNESFVLATGDAHDDVTLWKVERGNGVISKLEQFKLHNNWVGSVAFSPDGKTLASSSRDQSIILWNVSEQGGHPEPLKHDAPVLSVAFSSDGKTLASGSSDNTIYLWDVESHQSLGTLKGHEDWVVSVAFSPQDSNLLASGSRDGRVILWDVRRPTQPTILRLRDGFVWSVAFSPDGRLLAAGGVGGKIDLFSVADRQRFGKSLAGPSNPIFAVMFSRDSDTLASGSDDGTVILWDVKSGTRKVVFEPDRSQENGSNSVLSLAFSGDGTLAAGRRDKTITRWDLQTQRPLPLPLKGHKDSVRTLAYSSDGRLASGGSNAPDDDSNSQSEDYAVVLWDFFSSHQIRLEGHQGGVTSVAFSPDGKTLASGSEDSTVLLWNLKDDWMDKACRIANRNLTPAEWKQFLTLKPQECTCPNLPCGDPSLLPGR